ERDLDSGRALPALDVDRPRVQRFLVPVQMPDERLQAAFEVERALAIRALVDEGDPDALGQVGRFPKPLRDRLERVFGGLEHLRIRPKDRARATPVTLPSDLLHGALGLA